MVSLSTIGHYCTNCRMKSFNVYEQVYIQCVKADAAVDHSEEFAGQFSF